MANSTYKSKPTKLAKPVIRNNDLAQIHMAKKALNWSDEEYRDLLKTVCQVDSAGKLDAAGRARFLDHCEKCGWKGRYKGKNSRKRLEPGARKIYSLWQQLFEASLVRDRSFKALETWVKSQTGVDKLEWLNDAQAAQCIEQLKRWLERKAP